MIYQRQSVNHQHKHQQYRQAQVMSADPLQLIIMLYDVALTGCKERNLEKVTSALSELRNSLNHDDGGQVAADLLSLYLYLADEARKGKYDEVAQILQELRDTWATARENLIQEVQQPTEMLSVAA